MQQKRDRQREDRGVRRVELEANNGGGRTGEVVVVMWHSDAD